MSARIHTPLRFKRACNGCGNLLGDLDDRDVDQHGYLTDVRGECPTCLPLMETAPGPQSADAWNAQHPVGTPVVAYPGVRGRGALTTRTRTPAWTLGHGTPVVSVEGYAGGIALTHVDPIVDGAS